MAGVKRSIASASCGTKETGSLVLHSLHASFFTARLLLSSPTVCVFFRLVPSPSCFLLKQRCSESVLLSATTGFEHPGMTNPKLLTKLPVRLEWLLARPDSIQCSVQLFPTSPSVVLKAPTQADL